MLLRRALKLLHKRGLFRPHETGAAAPGFVLAFRMVPPVFYFSASSPNFDDRPDGTAIDMLVLHYTGMQSGEAALSRLRDRQAKVSSHYLVETDGRIFTLVDEEKRAWHAGRSFWAGHPRVNDRSVGIEIVNPGHEFGYTPFPEAQIAAVTALSQDILSRHPIPAQNVTGHADVAPARKMDPGEKFPWQQLASAGVGLWPAEPVAGPLGPENLTAETLSCLGYGLPAETGVEMAYVITAFQRHFRQERVDGVWDAACATALSGLLHRLI